MIKTLLITLPLVALCMVLLAVRVILLKRGKFGSTHVSENRAMRKQGIGCARSQDRAAQRKSRLAVDEVERR